MVNVAAITLTFQFVLRFLRTIRTVSPDISITVVGIDQLTQNLTVMHGCISGMVVADKLVLVVYIHVVLVTVVAFVMFLRPAGLGVLLAKLIGLVFPVSRDLARFDGLVLLPVIALFGYRYNRRIGDLTLASLITLLVKIVVELFE